MDTPRPKTRLGNDKATAFFAKTMHHWYPYLVVAHLRMPAFTNIIEHGQGTHQRQSRRIEGHQKHGGTPVGRRLRVRHRHDDGDAAVGMIGIARKPLVSGDDICITVPYGACLDIGSIRTRHLWLTHGEPATNLAGQQWFEPLLLLLWSAELCQNFHVACIGRTAVKNFRADWTPSHDLCQRCIFQVGQSSPICLVGQKEVPEASSAGTLLELLDDLWMVMGIPGGSDLFVRYRFRVIDILLHKSGERVLELAHLRRGCEIHTVLPLCMQSCILLCRTVRR